MYLEWRTNGQLYACEKISGEQSRVRLYTRAERAGDLLVAADDRENGCAALTWAQWRAVGRERANVSREAVGCQGCPGV